jgi:hypothetical protein
VASRPSPRGGASSRARGRSSSRRPASRSARGNSRSRSQSGSGSGSGFRDFLSEHLGRQADDVWGLLLVVVGLLCALGIWFDLTGPFGRFIKSVTGTLVGQSRLGLPLC